MIKSKLVAFYKVRRAVKEKLHKIENLRFYRILWYNQFVVKMNFLEE